MRCPICSSELREGATTCDECGCGILPPPPTGVEPTAFAREDAAPRWPLILSIIGVVAALGVIAVALFPVFKDDETSVATATTGSPSTVAVTTVAPETTPASTLR